MTPASHNKPIGIFDSGIGGITVLKALLQEFPSENFIYLGDTARLPYGSKSPETIQRYTQQNLEFLLKKNVKAFVIACNSASSHSMQDEFKGLPVYNVIAPGAQSAIIATKNQKIGVLGTQATIKSQSYERALRKLNAEIKVISQACPLFVPLAEEGLVEDEVTRIIGERYLRPLLQAQVDTIILGCTHYPILKPMLEKLAPPDTRWVESGVALSHQIKGHFKNQKLLPNKNQQNSPTIEIFSTDSSEHFNDLSKKLLAPHSPRSFAIADIFA